MAKLKRTAKTIEDFQAPWETKAADGTFEAGEIDAAKLKTYLFNLLGDVDTANAAAETAEAEKKTAEAALATKLRENETAEEKRKRETEESSANATKDKERADRAEQDKARLEVAIENGLTVTQAARLSGTTKDELDKDAKAYLEEIGKSGGGDDSEGGDGDQGVSSRSPVGQKPRTPNDPNPTGGSGSTPEEWAAEINSDFIL